MEKWFSYHTRTEKKKGENHSPLFRKEGITWTTREKRKQKRISGVTINLYVTIKLSVQLEASLLQSDNQSLRAWFSHEKHNLQLYVKLLGCHKII